MGLLITAAVCNGCRTCELACSFHHRGTFAPENSSIKAALDCQEGKVQLIVDSTCDLCPNELKPLCGRYCSTGALRKGKEHGAS